MNREAIRIDGDTQQRLSLSEPTITEYADAMRSGSRFPPVVVFFDGLDHWLADGFHRYHAACRLGSYELPVDVRTGTRRDAVIYAACANQSHGLRRTTADKRKAVETLVSDVEWAAWSDKEIARRCGVSDMLVGDVRRGFRTRSAVNGKPPQDKFLVNNREGTQQQESCSTRKFLIKGHEKAMNISNLKRGHRLQKGERHPETTKRLDVIRALADEGLATEQIARRLHLSAQHIRELMRSGEIVCHADRALGRRKRIDPNRIMQGIVDAIAEAPSDLNMIDAETVDLARIPRWLDSLAASQRAIHSLIVYLRKLVNQQKGRPYVGESKAHATSVEDPAGADRPDGRASRVN